MSRNSKEYRFKNMGSCYLTYPMDRTNIKNKKKVTSVGNNNVES